jgi:putative ABC transport system permease protein
MNFFTLGLRNILKNRRRSLVTVLAVALGFAAISLFAGYVHNVYAALADQAIRGERLGHLIVMKEGLLKQGKLEPEKYLLSAAEITRMTEVLRRDAAVALVTPRLGVSGLVSNGRLSTIFIGEGMVPEDVALIRGDFRLDRGGELDPGRPNAGAFASDLADILGLGEDDYAVLVTSTVEGLTNALDLEVQGIFNTGNTGTNDKFLLLPYAFAQRLLDTAGADRLTLLLADGSDAAAARDRALAAFQAVGIEGIAIKTWVEMSSFYTKVKNLFDMIFTFIFAIVVVIVMMSIVNTMSMAVMERTREIGTLRALGMRRFDITSLFCVEGILLAAVGGILGILLTGGGALLVNQLNLSYVPPSSSDAVLLLVDIVPPVMASAFLFLGLLAAVAALLPARQAARMAIVDALGHV